MPTRHTTTKRDDSPGPQMDAQDAQRLLLCCDDALDAAKHEGLRLHRHLTEAAQEWELLERDPGVLYRGVRLSQSLEWAQINSNQLGMSGDEYYKNLMGNEYVIYV